MTQDELDNKRFIADAGKIFARVSDNFRMGWEIHLASWDSIDNYTETDATEEENKGREDFERAQYEMRQKPEYLEALLEQRTNLEQAIASETDPEQLANLQKQLAFLNREIKITEEIQGK